MKRSPDRYRKLRAAIRKADRFKMKGKVREDFLRIVKGKC